MNIFLVGIVRDQEKSIQKYLKQLYNCLKNFGDVYIRVIESDSKDNTQRQLKDFKSKYKSFSYESLGDLSTIIPDRISRIRYCRNRYAEYLKQIKSNIDFVCVADLDGINRKLRSEYIANCFNSIIQWDVCSANQRFGYYDLYALRAKGWCETDIFEELKFAKDNNRIGLSESDLRNEIIYKKMSRIPKSSAWIPVDSAFGGFTIYRGNPFKKYDYSPIQGANINDCEHVSLHTKMVLDGLKIFINPGLINSNINNHNIMRIKIIRKIIIKTVLLRQSFSGRKYI